MGKDDHIQENMASKDEFIKEMYTDLYMRIKEYEETDSVVQKIKFSDTIGSIIIVGMIALFLTFIVLV